MNNQKQKEKQVIHSISYNSDSSLMALATNHGFKVYSTNPTLLKQDRDFGAPIRLCQLINRSNLIALVGFKETPFAPPNKLALFDDDSQRIIADMSFKTTIKGVKIRQQKIVVQLYNKVFLINLFTMEIEHILSTFAFDETEDYSTISLSNDPNNFLLAAPGVQNGQLLLVYLNKLTQRIVKAHNSILSAVQLTEDGQKLATSSEKGINIRIFDTRTGQMLQQMRRGNQFATIYSLSFSKSGSWLAVSSDSCNVHIFAVKMTEKQKKRQYAKQSVVQKQNPKSMFYFMKKVFSHFDAQYSYCSYKVEEFVSEMQSRLSFMEDQTIHIMTNIGIMERIRLNSKGGKCLLDEKRYLINIFNEN